MTYEKALSLSQSTIADGLITAAVEDREFWQTVINALEKQIPKKPIEIIQFVDGERLGLCPNCNEGVNEEMNFCDQCSQKLDWSEEK